MTATVALAQGPDLLAITASRLSSLVVRPTVKGLHAAFRQVVTEVRQLDTSDDRQLAVADDLGDELIDALAEYLVFCGQHPHPDHPRTVDDWLGSAPMALIAGQLADAASWWAAELTPERLR